MSRTRLLKQWRVTRTHLSRVRDLLLAALPDDMRSFYRLGDVAVACDSEEWPEEPATLGDFIVLADQGIRSDNRGNTCVRRTSALAVAALLMLCGCRSDSMNPDGPDFLSFLQTWEEAQEAFINGDPTKWKANSAHGADATIFGGFGGFEKGWKEVGSRYDWAASQFQHSGATKAVEYLSTGESGDLAFTVSIERSQVRTGPGADESELALRVTQIFRKEGGSWKLLHRHADPMVETKPPGA